MQGLILLAHGARDPSWAAPFEAVARRIESARPELSLRLAFLEFMAPNLAAAGRELAAFGCDDVTVMPMFLGTGGHVRKDLPRLLESLHDAHPHVRWHLPKAVGEHDVVLDAMAAATLAALDDGGRR